MGWPKCETIRSLREGALDVVEHVAFLPAGISDELSINVVRILGRPPKEGLVRVSDSLERKFANNTADIDSRVSHDELIC